MLARSLVARLEEGEAIMAVELVRVHHDHALAVVAAHHLVGELIDRVLEPRFFGIDVDLDAALG